MRAKKTERIEIDENTYYVLNEDGYGAATSRAQNLDNAADAVAQSIGFPITYGSWTLPNDPKDRSKPAFLSFLISEDAFESWKATVNAENGQSREEGKNR